MSCKRVPMPSHLRRATARPRVYVERIPKAKWECAVCWTWWPEHVEICKECDTPRGLGVQLNLMGGEQDGE